jgi:hypothetical protein
MAPNQVDEEGAYNDNSSGFEQKNQNRSSNEDQELLF